MSNRETKSGFGMVALRAYADRVAPDYLPDFEDCIADAETRTELVGDLLADLMHVCGDEEFDVCLERARWHFVAEVEEDLAEMAVES